jgi:hypothetical protein
MSQKLSDLAKEERKIIEEHLEGISSSLGMDVWESYSANGMTGLKELVGMCHNCKNLNYCKTEFNTVHAICSAFEFKLTGQNRITECNLHSPKGVLTLNEMYAMAYLIDPDGNKKVEGFIPDKLRKENQKKKRES